MQGEEEVQQLIRAALAEDIGSGDVTSLALVGENDETRATIIAKGDYVLCGGYVTEEVFRQVDDELSIKLMVEDGKSLKHGDVVLELEGKARSILTGERTALNFLQHLSGVATMARTFVDEVAPRPVQILDTRKTIPGFRLLEKYAVACGGGTNHRMGLFDMILIKDNHLAYWGRHQEGSWAGAVRQARKAYPDLEIEVEVETLDALLSAIEAKPDWIMLDNMGLDDLKACVEACDGRCKLEASGGVTLETVKAIAETGVDAISVGALSHSAPAADLSLEFEAPSPLGGEG